MQHALHRPLIGVHPRDAPRPAAERARPRPGEAGGRGALAAPAPAPTAPYRGQTEDQAAAQQ